MFYKRWMNFNQNSQRYLFDCLKLENDWIWLVRSGEWKFYVIDTQKVWKNRQILNWWCSGLFFSLFNFFPQNLLLWVCWLLLREDLQTIYNQKIPNRLDCRHSFFFYALFVSRYDRLLLPLRGLHCSYAGELAGCFTARSL